MHAKTILELLVALEELQNAPAWRFNRNLRRNLREEPGVYVISRIDQPMIAIRAGTTITAKDGLRQRVYKNQFMGDQKGNLRQQLVGDGVCASMDETKAYIQNHLQVKVLVIADNEWRKRVENFMLAVLNPKYP